MHGKIIESNIIRQALMQLCTVSLVTVSNTGTFSCLFLNITTNYPCRIHNFNERVD